MVHRRSLLGWLVASGAAGGAEGAEGAGAAGVAATASAAEADAPLRFPADFGAHPASRTEWWYVTGQLSAGARLWGFQVTFFRVSTGVREAAGGASAVAAASRFAPSQLLFAHAAVTDLERRRLRHDQRIARSGFGIAQARVGDTAVTLRDWHFERSAMRADAARALPASAAQPIAPPSIASTEVPTDASRYRTQVRSESAGFMLDLQFDTTQPPLLQGEAGLSRKGPGAGNTSRYYSQPQLAASGTLALDGQPAAAVQGRAWLDHEWSDAYIPPGAVGWDWIGMNLDDGSALTAFRLRRADGSALYAGGSWRRAGERAARSFAPGEVVFTPGRIWASTASRTRYPVQWVIDTPAGRFGVNALLDDQELDSRASTGAIYWEGLSDLVDPATGRRLGRGYLEMTGYAGALRM
jgi:predicted secreted hydrolase